MGIANSGAGKTAAFAPWRASVVSRMFSSLNIVSHSGPEHDAALNKVLEPYLKKSVSAVRGNLEK